MPWTAPSGIKYRLCLLDTNAISEIVKNPPNYAMGFIGKFGPETHVPCITIYSLIELRRNKVLFQKYLQFFSNYPSILIKPVELLYDEELKAIKENTSVNAFFHAFSPLGKDSSYNLNDMINQIFDSPLISKHEDAWRENEYNILKIWNKNKVNFKPTRATANAQDAARFVNEAGLQFLIGHFSDWSKNELIAGRVPKVDNFPSLQVSLYSIYYRMFDISWKQKPQEVTDLRIVAAAPYVDVIVTEKFQAEILRKIHNRVEAIRSLEIAKIKDIRTEKK